MSKTDVIIAVIAIFEIDICNDWPKTNILMFTMLIKNPNPNNIYILSQMGTFVSLYWFAIECTDRIIIKDINKKITNSTIQSLSLLNSFDLDKENPA